MNIDRKWERSDAARRVATVVLGLAFVGVGLVVGPWSGLAEGDKSKEKKEKKKTEKQETEKKKNNGFETVDTHGFTNDFHKKHKGKIVFSSEPIPEDPGDSFESKKSFNLDDKLYMRAFFNDSPANVLRKDGFRPNYGAGDAKFRLEVQIREMERHNWIESETRKLEASEFKLQTAYQFDNGSFLDREDGEVVRVTDDGNDGFKFFVGKVLPVIPPMGPSKITVYAIAEMSQAKNKDGKFAYDVDAIVASGSFTLNVKSPPAKRKLFDDHGPKLPESNHPNHAALEKATIERTKQEWDEPAKKVTFPETGWTVERHETSGDPVKRRLPAYAVSPGTSGSCVWNEITIYQNYSGNGSYTDRVTELSVGEHGSMPCPE